MAEDHEKVKFENLKLMLHFKSEFMVAHDAIDGLVRTFEHNGNRMTDIKQTQHSAKMRIRDEINSLNMTLQERLSL